MIDTTITNLPIPQALDGYVDELKLCYDENFSLFICATLAKVEVFKEQVPTEQAGKYYARLLTPDDLSS